MLDVIFCEIQLVVVVALLFGGKVLDTSTSLDSVVGFLVVCLVRVERVWLGVVVVNFRWVD